MKLFACGGTHAEDSSSMVATDWRSPSLVAVSEIYDFDTETRRVCSLNITGAAAVMLVMCSGESGKCLINHEKQQSQMDSTTNYNYGEIWLLWCVLENVLLNKALLHLCYQSAATKQLMSRVLTDQLSRITTTVEVSLVSTAK